jgi:hypothetical protein
VEFKSLNDLQCGAFSENLCRLKTTEMEELGFIVDTTAEGDSELLKDFNSPFPIFSTSSFVLGVDESEEKSEKSDSEDENDEDEYFGKISRFFLSISII